MKPSISIIMPVYNSLPYLRQCIESVLKQSFSFFELICVDDGSTDGSFEVINELAATDKRIQILHQENLYAGVARNYGMKYARGEYLLFLDSDDLFDPKMLEMLYEHMIKSNADICIFGAQRLHTQSNEITPMPWACRTKYAPDSVVFSNLDAKKHIFNITSPNPWNKIFRKEFVFRENLQFQDLHNANDLFFVFASLSKAQKITILDIPLVTYRIGIGKNIQSDKSKDPLAFYKAFLALKEEIDKAGNFDKYEQSYLNSLMSNAIFNLNTAKDFHSFSTLYNLIHNGDLGALGLNKQTREYFYGVYHKEFDQYLQVMRKEISEYLFDQLHSFVATSVSPISNRSNSEIDTIRSSASYRIGRVITWLPRKIRDSMV